MYIFPVHLLAPRKVARYLERQVLSGGTALSGDEDVIEVDGGGRWAVQYEGIQLVDAEQARVWEAWNEYLSGGVNTCLVPLLSFATGPRPSTQLGGPKRPSDLYYDDREWPTELRYAARDHEAEFSAPGNLRDTAAGLRVTRGPGISSGQLFSYGDGRLHRVVRPNGGGIFKILPPLRGAVAAGAEVSFDFPVVRARMAPNENFAIGLERGRQGEVSVKFVESPA